MVKYIIPLALLLSCTKTVRNDKLKISLNEIAVEYEIMTFDEFRHSEVIYKPDNVMLTFTFYNEIDTSYLLNFAREKQTENSFIYWINDGDSIKLRAFDQKQTLLPKQEWNSTYMLPYNSIGDLQNIFKQRDINSINQHLMESKFVFKSDSISNVVFYDVSVDEFNTVFNFLDTAIFLN